MLPLLVSSGCFYLMPITNSDSPETTATCTRRIVYLQRVCPPFRPISLNERVSLTSVDHAAKAREKVKAMTLGMPTFHMLPILHH